MLCPKCKNQIRDTAKFCSNCGCVIRNVNNAPNPAPQNSYAYPAFSETNIQPQYAQPPYIPQQPQYTQATDAPQQSQYYAHQQPTQSIFKSMDIMGLIKNPFKTAFQAFSGQHKQLGIAIAITLSLLLPLGFLVISGDEDLLSSFNMSDESAGSIFLSTLLTAIAVFLSKWLINFGVSKLFGISEMNAEGAFNFTAIISAWSIIPSIIATLIMMTFDIDKISDVNDLPTLSVYLLIGTAFCALIFRCVLMFTTYLAKSRNINPLRIAGTVLVSEIAGLLSFFLLASIILPSEVYEGFGAFAVFLILSPIFENALF